MSKDKISDYSTTASDNTDIAGIGIQGTNAVSNFDGAFRTIMKQLADMNAGTSPIFDTFTVCDPVDTTKKVRIDAGTVATGTTRVLTMPNADITPYATTGGVLSGAPRVMIGAVSSESKPLSFGHTDNIERWSFYQGTSDELAIAPHDSSGTFIARALTIGQDKAVRIGVTAIQVPGYGQGAGTALHSTGLISSARSGSGENSQIQRDTSGNIFQFAYGALGSSPASVGGISTNGVGVSYNTASDYRLKYDVSPLVTFTLSSDDFGSLDDALLRVMSYRPVTYRWISAPEKGLQTGFIAHELQQIAPHAVTGQRDGMTDIGTATVLGYVIPAHPHPDDENEIVPERTVPDREIHDIPENQAPEGSTWLKTGTRDDIQTVDHSKLTPDLTAGLQSAVLMILNQGQLIKSLEARLSALEAS